MVGHRSMRSEIECGSSCIPLSYNTYDPLASRNRTPWTTHIGQNVRMEPKDRLKQARLAAGYETPSDAARALKNKGINKNTLISHENGNRAISRKAAEKYAKAFGVRAGWLLYGEAENEAPLNRLREVLARVESKPREFQERIIDFVEYQLDRYEKKSRDTET